MVDDTYTFMQRPSRRCRSYLVKPFFGYDEVEPSQEILTPIPLQNDCGHIAAMEERWSAADMLAARQKIRRRRIFRAWYKERWGVEI